MVFCSCDFSTRMQTMQNMMNQVGNPQQMVGTAMGSNPNQMQGQPMNSQQLLLRQQMLLRQQQQQQQQHQQQQQQQQMHMGVSISSSSGASFFGSITVRFSGALITTFFNIVNYSNRVTILHRIRSILECVHHRCPSNKAPVILVTISSSSEWAKG